MLGVRLIEQLGGLYYYYLYYFTSIDGGTRSRRKRWRLLVVYSPNGHQVLWGWWTIEYINRCYLWTVNLLVFAIGGRLSRVFRGQLSGGKFTVVIHEVKKKKVALSRMNEKQLVWDQWHSHDDEHLTGTDRYLITVLNIFPFHSIHPETFKTEDDYYYYRLNLPSDLIIILIVWLGLLMFVIA